MANSPRLSVLIALSDLLKTMTPANGWGYDLSESVFRGRSKFGEDDPETMVSILEAPKPDYGLTSGENGGHRKEEWNLLLQGWCPEDHDNPTDPAHEMMWAVEQLLNKVIAVDGRSGNPKYPAEYMLGNKITGFAFGPGVVRPATEGISNRAFFYLPVRVGLVTRNG